MNVWPTPYKFSMKIPQITAKIREDVNPVNVINTNHMENIMAQFSFVVDESCNCFIEYFSNILYLRVLKSPDS